jgi:hypothetical protein
MTNAAAHAESGAAAVRPHLLSTLTLRNLSRYFASKGHKPSPAMWNALADLTITLEAMADGVAAPKFFLSSLDPGVGKTQTITHFVDALLSQRSYDDVGILICVARLSEVENLIHEMGIPNDNLAVLTSDATLNALGKAPAGQAQVLITTQQRIEKRVSDGSFNAADEFFYLGAPRSVRIWDESYLPGQTVTLNRDDVAFLFKPLRSTFPKLTDAIEDLFSKLREIKDRTVLQLPNFAGEHDVDLNDILRLFDDPRDNDDQKLKDDQRMALSSLWFLSGKTVTIRRDGDMGNTVIDYRDTLPDDLAPMVILDASGRVRDTYRDIEQNRGTLVRLKTAVKRYDNLTVHLWQTGGGKQAFKTNGSKLIAGIAKTIDTKPSERWLVVTHRKGNKVGDVEKEVRALINTPAENVAFIHWGKHMATNDYINYPNVILAGTLFFRVSFYESLKRLAANRPSTEGAVTREEIDRVMVGEHSHAILQALCRGAVRRCDGEHCPPCDAYIIGSVRSGIPTALPNIFPGCQLTRWKPIERTLKGHVGAAVKMIETWAQTATPIDTLPFKIMTKALKITSHDFKFDVRKHPEFIEAVAECGVVEWGKGTYFTGFALAS